MTNSTPKKRGKQPPEIVRSVIDTGIAKSRLSGRKKATQRPVLTPLAAIRAHCIECFGGQRAEVEHCPSQNCNLYPYRQGRNPNRKGVGGRKERT